MRQTIIWTNADPVNWRIYAALGGDEYTGMYILIAWCIAWKISSFYLKMCSPNPSHFNIFQQMLVATFRLIKAGTFQCSGRSWTSECVRYCAALSYQAFIPRLPNGMNDNAMVRSSCKIREFEQVSNKLWFWVFSHVPSFAMRPKVFLRMVETFSLRCCTRQACLVFYLPINNDVIKWKHFQRYWPFVRGIHRSPGDSPHKGQWRGALMFSLICACTNG